MEIAPAITERNRIMRLSRQRKISVLQRAQGAVTRCIAPIVVLLAAGCAPLVDQVDQAATPRHVFAVGFENLTDRYIEPISINDITMSGLSALSDFDAAINVGRTGANIQLRMNDVIAAERPAPDDRDAYGWAFLTANIIEDARRASALLRTTSYTDIYEKVFAGALSGLDRYSRYSGPREARRARAARDGFGGLGITIKVQGGLTSITTVHPGTPAHRSGLQARDRITHIDGFPIYGLSQDDIVDRLRGPVDQPVRVTIKRADAEDAMQVSVVRSLIVPPTVSAKRLENLLYIEITSFNQGTLDSMKRELKNSQSEFASAIKGIILDLRGNPGGLLDQAVDIADLFLSDGRIISTKGRHPESDQIFDATAGELTAGLPLAVLINGKSASAAEILAVALRDQGRAVLFGSSSYGKGTVQTIIRLPNSGEMILTWARLHAPSGQTLHKQAIVPAFCTNGAKTATAKAMQLLRSAAKYNNPLPASGIKALPRGPHYAKPAHSACPSNAARPGTDLEAARLLLGNRIAYRQALLTKQPSMARR